MPMEIDFTIVQQGNQWCLLSKKTGKTLACHPTREDAIKQEQAIKAQGGVMMESKDMSTQNYGDTRSIRGVEIFASGEWNGDAYTDEDIDKLVDSFDETKSKLRPYLKLGHNNDQDILKKDGLPSAGFIDRIYRVGKKLLADFSEIPEKVYELLKKRAYDRVSSEIFVNMKIGDKTYPYALKAVALLGGDTPAVHDLNSILNLYSNGYDSVTYSDIEEYEITNSYFNKTTEDTSMTIEEAVRQISKFESEIKSYQEENASLNKDLDEVNDKLKKSLDDLKEFKEKADLLEKQFKTQERATFEREIDAEIEKFVMEGKIVPAQKPFLSTLLKNAVFNGETKEFKIADKEFKDVRSLVKALIDSKSEIDVSGEPHTELTVPSNDDDRFVQQVKKYALENKLSFKDAYLRLAPKNQ